MAISRICELDVACFAGRTKPCLLHMPRCRGRKHAAFVGAALTVTSLASASADTGCPRPRQQLVAPPERIAERGAPVRGWRVLDLRQTLEYISTGASFLRLQVEELTWLQEGTSSSDVAEDLLRGKLLGKASGRIPQDTRSIRDLESKTASADGPCIAVDDVLSPGWSSAFSEHARERMLRSAAGGLQQQLISLNPSSGFLCNAAVIDSGVWDRAHASKYELQDLWADVLGERRVLLVLGESSPSNEDLAPLVQRSALAAARHVASGAVISHFDELLQELRLQTSEFDVVVVTGLRPGLGALLVSGLDCTVQAIDAGKFAVAHGHASFQVQQQHVPALVTFCGLTGSESCGTNNEPWTGQNYHPRPHIRRLGGHWMNLNGQWKAHVGRFGDEHPPEYFNDGELEVPFPAESSRGGLRLRISEREVLWLRRLVDVPAGWRRVLLRIDACDWECWVYVERRLVGKHRGGYDPFMFDITEPSLLRPKRDASLQTKEGEPTREVEIIIRVWDPTDAGCEYVAEPPVPCESCCKTGWQPRGKQSLQPGFIMYSAATGPWQTIWLEGVSQDHCLIRSAQAEILHGKQATERGAIHVRITAQLESETLPCDFDMRLLAVVTSQGKEVVRGEGPGPFAVELLVSDPHLWSPEDPYLYEALLALCAPGNACGDTVEFVFGLRQLSISSGVPGPKQEQDLLLNGKRIFQHGVLYQPYWPESLITPPSHNALVDEVKRIKESGFNLIRVHAAVMPALFYHLCDREGLLVWQDFPAGDQRALPLWDAARHGAEQDGTLGLDEITRSEESQAAFWIELQRMVAFLSSFSCVVTWVPFNEAWGQFATLKVVRWLRDFGGGRWINAASGWNDVSDLYPGVDAGDFADMHNYEGPPYGHLNGTFESWPLPYNNRALALGEYGGLGLYLDGHELDPEASWAYGNVSATGAELAEKLSALAQRLSVLMCENRMSAAVYTQWNDVETEINGLVSYDRVPKLPRETLREFASTVIRAHSECLPSRSEA